MFSVTAAPGRARGRRGTSCHRHRPCRTRVTAVIAERGGRCPGRPGRRAVDGPGDGVHDAHAVDVRRHRDAPLGARGHQLGQHVLHLLLHVAHRDHLGRGRGRHTGRLPRGSGLIAVAVASPPCRVPASWSWTITTPTRGTSSTSSPPSPAPCRRSSSTTRRPSTTWPATATWCSPPAPATHGHRRLRGRPRGAAGRDRAGAGGVPGHAGPRLRVRRSCRPGDAGARRHGPRGARRLAAVRGSRPRSRRSATTRWRRSPCPPCSSRRRGATARTAGS